MHPPIPDGRELDRIAEAVLITAPLGHQRPVSVVEEEHPLQISHRWRAVVSPVCGPCSSVRKSTGIGTTRHGRISTKRLSDRAVADMIARWARAAGLDGHFAGHSLRSAAVMRGYVEEGGIWADNAAAKLGL